MQGSSHVLGTLCRQLQSRKIAMINVMSSEAQNKQGQSVCEGFATNSMANICLYSTPMARDPVMSTEKAVAVMMETFTNTTEPQPHTPDRARGCYQTMHHSQQR